MSREYLVRRAIELSKLVKDSRAVLAKAMDEDTLENVIALSQAIVAQIARFVQDPAQFSEADYQRVIAMQSECQELLDRAITGRGQTPLRGLEGSDDQEGEPEGDDEEPASDQEKSPQEDFAVSIVPRRKRKADEPEGIDVSETEDSDDPRQARWPSEQMKPSQGKPAHGLAKSLGAQDERLRVLLAEPDIHDLLTPVSRKRKGSAIMNVKGA